MVVAPIYQEFQPENVPNCYIEKGVGQFHIVHNHTLIVKIEYYPVLTLGVNDIVIKDTDMFCSKWGSAEWP